MARLEVAKNFLDLRGVVAQCGGLEPVANGFRGRFEPVIGVRDLLPVLCCVPLCTKTLHICLEA